MAIKLYWTDSLPEHYVAEDEDGEQWLIPVAPISPEAWERRKPYRGNYTLERVVPSAIEKFYQPGGGEPEKRGPGRPKKDEPVKRLDLRLRADVYDVLAAEKERTGNPIKRLVETAVMLMLPEAFEE